MSFGLAVRTALAISISFICAGLCAAASSPGTSAVIVNSGSTNTPGYRILVKTSGDAEYSVEPRRHGPRNAATQMQRRILSALVQRFYSDLKAAMPFSALPHRGCMKSVSSGTTLRIEFDSEQTPDLSCRGDNTLGYRPCGAM